MAITILGEKTKSIFLKGPENHKLHHEFEVAAGQTIKKGQPVILTADGEVSPAGTAAESTTIIGYSVHNGAEGELVTVAMKAYIIVWAMPKAAVIAGPVAYDGMNTTDEEYNSVAAVALDAESTTMGWALDAATAPDEPIRVALI